MVDLGILVTNMNQEQQYFNEVANIGASLGVAVYVFLPTDIHPLKRTVVGTKFCPKTKSWKHETFPIPTFIYDRCFYRNKVEFKKYHPILSWLKSLDEITFLGHGLPNKWIVYKALLCDQSLTSFLPKTELFSDVKQVFSILDNEKSVLFKPVSGSQGKGIFVLEMKGNDFILLSKKGLKLTKKLLTKIQVKHLLSKIGSNTYLLQPFLSLKNHNEQPFDIRIFLQKDRYGKWLEVGRGIRIGRKNDFTSNLATGGSILKFEEWLNQFSINDQQSIQNDISCLLDKIPNVLEGANLQLFEIGIDLSVDRASKLWLLEVNSKPGRKVITTCFPDRHEQLAKGPIEYCLYLNERLS